MEILLCPNNYYVFPTLVLLESLFKHNYCQIHIHVIHSELTEENVQKLTGVVEKHGASIKFYKITPESLGHLPTSIHITVEAYYRLLAFKLLPQEIERVLYLDGDLIANKSLEPLYQTSFEMESGNALFVACEGPGVSQNEWSVYDALAIPYDKLYCNSGVLVMNLAAMRKELNPNIFWDFIAQNQDKLKYHDQDTLNALFYDRIKYVDWHIWNQTVLHIKDKKEAKERLKNAAILHYAGSDKPWNYDYASWWMSEFWKYARTGSYHDLYYLTIARRFMWHIKNKLESGKKEFSSIF